MEMNVLQFALVPLEKEKAKREEKKQTEIEEAERGGSKNIDRGRPYIRGS